VVEDLTLQQAVTLLALFRGENQTLDRSLPLSEQLEPLAPTPMVELDWVRGLYEARLLGVHPESPIDAFVWEDDRPARFYLRAVSYYPAGRGPLAARSQALIRELVTVLREGPWPESWRGEWQGVWRELAVAECLAYLALILTDHNMPFTVDDRAMLLFEDLLTSYSIGQAYCFVWRAVKDAVAWHVRRGVPYERVGSATVTFIERALGQARAGSWSVRTYRRDRRLPQSLLSHTFYVTAMHVTDELAVRLAEVGPPKAAVRPTPTPPPEPEPADAAQVTYLSPQPRRVETVPRNAPCPCGSGKKFKRCHGRHNPGQEP
jgi:SEC-C motif